MLCADSLSSRLLSSASLGELGLSHQHTDETARHETDRGATGSQHSPVPLWTESFAATQVLGAFR